MALKVEYPRGEEFRGSFTETAVRVHSGGLVIPLRLEQSGAIAGMPRIVVTYQACTDKACLEPRTVVLDVRIVGEN